MRVLWAVAAERDRASIFDYLSEESPLAAIRMDEIFAEAVSRLPDHPYLGKAGQISGTRELIPHESYRLLYEVTGETIRILALVHTARLWPPMAP